MSVKKIVHIVPALRQGGIERMISLFSMHSQKWSKNYLFTAWSIVDFPFSGVIYSAKSEKFIEIEKTKLSFFRVLAILQSNIKFVLKLWKIKPDVCLVHGKFSLAFSVLPIIFSPRSVKFVFIKQNIWVLNRWQTWLLIRFSCRVQFVVTASHGLLRTIERLNIHKKYVIYNPVDVKSLQKRIKRHSLQLTEDPKIVKILSIGRYSVQKGQWHLIRIVKELIKDGYNVKCDILGGHGKLFNKLNKLVVSLGVQNYVTLHEFTSIYYFLAQADIFYLPSNWEGFGVVLIEALAAGVPVISTDCDSGPREIFGYGILYDNLLIDQYVVTKCGVLTPVMGDKWLDFQPLTAKEKINMQAIERIIKDGSLKKRLVVNGYKKVRNFDIDNILEEWKNLLMSDQL